MRNMGRVDDRVRYTRFGAVCVGAGRRNNATFCTQNTFLEKTVTKNRFCFALFAITSKAAACLTPYHLWLASGSPRAAGVSS